jgi:hypothetical protein
MEGFTNLPVSGWRAVAFASNCVPFWPAKRIERPRLLR